MRSVPPVSSMRLSGMKASDHTGRPGPTRVRTMVRLARSINATEPRIPAAASRRPSGETAMAMIGVVCATISPLSSPVADRK